MSSTSPASRHIAYTPYTLVTTMDRVKQGMLLPISIYLGEVTRPDLTII